MDLKAMLEGGGDDEADKAEPLGEEAVHLRRMFAAQKSGDMKAAAAAFKRAVQACVEGEYDDEGAGEEDEDTGY